MGSARILGTHPHRLQLRITPGGLERFHSVFGCESAHNQCHPTVGCHVDGCRVNSLHVFRGASTSLIDSHNKFDVLHSVISLVEKLSLNGVVVHFCEVENKTAVVSMNKMCEKPHQSATDVLLVPSLFCFLQRNYPISWNG